MRRLRVQLTVLLGLLGLLVAAWGAAVFLGARDAARSSAVLRSTVDRADELRRSATRLSRDLVTMETSRRAYLVTGDEAARRAHLRAEARAQRVSAGGQDRTYEAAQALAVRTALMMLAALVLIAVWLRRAVGAPADALRTASGRLAGGDLETPVELGVENELGAVASDLETMRRRLAGRMEALERLRHLSAQVVGATSLQRLAEVALDGLRPEVGATRAILGAARPAGDLVLRALAGFPDPRVADDIVKADAEIRRVLPLPSLRAGQVVGLADLDEVAGASPALGEPRSSRY